MRIYDIIAKKRDKIELSDEEIKFFIDGYVSGKIADYQASALLMAIYLNGMTDREMVSLTKYMAESGDMLCLNEIDGVCVDKHSTGGVGDKTTLIVAPIVASVGLKVAKMSGRGLGHTGGTVDKLESIDGFKVELPPEDFLANVKKAGICVVGQTGEFAPADKKIYALRDATATVGNIPLIASSIMSKKLAAGASCIVLDVKYGSGAFMKTPELAEELSEKMVRIGKDNGRKMAAVVSDMNTPLGRNIGNILEIKEAIEVLNGQGSEDLTTVCLTLAANLISLGFDIDGEKAMEMAKDALDSKKAFAKFKEFITLQGGDVSLIEEPEKFEKAKFVHKVIAKKSGYITFMDAEKIGTASVILGAGRASKEDSIDYTAGIVLFKKTHDEVSEGDVLCELHTNDERSIEIAERIFLEAVTIQEEKGEKTPLIYKVIK